MQAEEKAEKTAKSSQVRHQSEDLTMKVVYSSLYLTAETYRQTVRNKQKESLVG